KSNLFEALYCLNPYVEGASYDTAEDWPVDDWNGRDSAKSKPVSRAIFSLSLADIEELFEFAAMDEDDDDGETELETAAEAETPPSLPKSLSIFAKRCYGSESSFCLSDENGNTIVETELGLVSDKVSDWIE